MNAKWVPVGKTYEAWVAAETARMEIVDHGRYFYLKIGWLIKTNESSYLVGDMSYDNDSEDCGCNRMDIISGHEFVYGYYDLSDVVSKLSQLAQGESACVATKT
jgi:hypothetical protein